ncbi:hypothetical protein F4777DRAFT_555487 [Nemania sp. FL0916]|nr:hypothetical protein F4777DRAFT_555487 [Nemania sp. FL0916]
MESPPKRLRLGPSPYGDDDDEEDQDELSMSAEHFNATQDPMYQLDKKRAKAATRLKSTFEDIFDKYGKDFTGDDDVINFYTDEIEVDNGHVQTMESRDGAAAAKSTSSDEEERILLGKSGVRGDRPKSKAKVLMPAPLNRSRSVQMSQMSQHQSVWNEPPSLSTYRLSSLAFPSSPYGALPPFDFGRPPFETGHIDPAWQAPDLPVQLSHLQHARLSGIGAGQFGSFGVEPYPAVKRVVSAKSLFIRSISTASETSDGDEEDEDEDEDDILLGRKGDGEERHCRPENNETNVIPAASETSSQRLVQQPGEPPPFHGVGLIGDQSQSNADTAEKEVAQTTVAECAAVGIVESAPQPATMDARHHDTPKKGDSSYQARRKRKQQKLPGTPGSVAGPHGEPINEARSLLPNERRIEIVFPTIRRPLPVEITQVADGAASMAEEGSQEPSFELAVHTHGDMDAMHLQGDIHAPKSNSGHEDSIPDQLPADSAEISEAMEVDQNGQAAQHIRQTAPSLPPRNSLERQPSPIQKPMDLLQSETTPHDEQCLRLASVDANGKSSSPQTMIDNATPDIVAVILDEMLQGPEFDNEGVIISDQLRSTVEEVSEDDEQTACDTNEEDSAETIPGLEHEYEKISAQSSASEALCDVTADSVADSSDVAPTEETVSETAILHQLEGVYDKNEHTTADEADHLPANTHERDLPSAEPPGSDISRAFHHDPQLGDDVFSPSDTSNTQETRISTLERIIRSPSATCSAILGVPDYDLPPSRGSLPPIFVSSGISEIADLDESNQQLPSSSALITEIDGLQLDTDQQDNVQGSPSLGARESPDQDLPIPLVISDSRPTSLPVSRLATSTPEPGIQQDISISGGRFPSPELGTPTGPEILRGSAPRSKNAQTPTTPTRRRGPKSKKSQTMSHNHTLSIKRSTLSSLIPDSIEDESDDDEDELSIAGSFSGASTRPSRFFNLPFSRGGTNNDESPKLPPMLSTPRRRAKTQKDYLMSSSPSSGRNAPPPATDLRARSGNRRGRGQGRAAVHSSPLSRVVAERLLSSPTKKYRANAKTSMRTTSTAARETNSSDSLVASPHGTLRRCGEDGFVCARAFCLTCCK